VPGGRVVGPTVAVITSADRMLSDVSLDWGRPGMEHFAYRRFRLPRCQNLKGSALVLACTGSDTYFHWLTDALPRLEIAARAQGEGWRPDYWVVNTLNRPFVRESLSLLRIPLEKVIPLDKNPHVKFSSLWVPSLPCESSSGNSPPWIIKYLKRAFIGKELLGTLSARTKSIWIDRSKSKSRKITLSDQQKAILDKHDFSIVDLTGYNFSEQIKLFQQTGAAFGPHGAGFSNLIFCNSAKVCEIFFKGYVNPCYYALSQCSGLDYYYHVLPFNETSNHALNLNFFENVFIRFNLKHF
jgi:capsular polysaccharide biosynthesis protein